MKLQDNMDNELVDRIVCEGDESADNLDLMLDRSTFLFAQARTFDGQRYYVLLVYACDEHNIRERSKELNYAMFNDRRLTERHTWTTRQELLDYVAATMHATLSDW